MASPSRRRRPSTSRARAPSSGSATVGRCATPSARWSSSAPPISAGTAPASTASSPRGRARRRSVGAPAGARVLGRRALRPARSAQRGGGAERRLGRRDRVPGARRDRRELDRALQAAGIARVLAPMTSSLQVGFFAQRVMDQLGVPAVASALRRIRSALEEALGEERGEGPRGGARRRAGADAAPRAST